MSHDNASKRSSTYDGNRGGKKVFVLVVIVCVVVLVVIVGVDVGVVAVLDDVVIVTFVDVVVTLEATAAAATCEAIVVAVDSVERAERIIVLGFSVLLLFCAFTINTHERMRNVKLCDPIVKWLLSFD